MNMPHDTPLVIRHRINTVAELRGIDPKYGVEVDIRHDNRNGRLYLNHDPGDGDDFEAYVKVLAERKIRFAVLNIKEAGIERRAIDMMTAHGLRDWFLLDVEFPFIYRGAFSVVPGLDGRVAIRFSEAEPIEQALALAGKCHWVWIDVNTRLPLDIRAYERLKQAGYRLALVCPERWGRPEDIGPYIEQMRRDGIMVDTVMTSGSHVAEWEQSGVIKSFSP